MAKSPSPAYQKLALFSTKIHTYGSILSLLQWDHETYMPPGALAPRSKQIAQLSTLIHREKTSRTFKGLLEKLVHLSTGKIKVKGLSLPQIAAVKEWRREFLKATKLPSSFIETFSEITSQATAVWAEARKSNNFKLFAPFLEKILTLNRKKADILGFAEHPYDALIEGYEPCMTANRLTSLFGGLEQELKGILKKLKKTHPKAPFLHKEIAQEKQMEIARLLLSKLPIDPAHSRLDLSNHPFSIAIHPHDSRITTRILPNAFLSNIFSVLHEAGHSFYEMGLPSQHFGTPLAESVSLSIHESQSRWWETLIGRSLPFWKFFYPILQKTLPHLKNVPLSRFYPAMHEVAPSFIRVEADEVTYCLHVILRFELEKKLVGGELQVADLPEAWNHKMKELLGITPSDDAKGCLQDIHWSLGDFGYFPTYALGNLFAAQFFTAFAKQHPDWEKKVETGNFSFILEWLNQNIHAYGRMYDSEALVKKVTGKSLSETAYTHYLRKKYLIDKK